MTSSFDQYFREWARAACAECGFPEPAEDFYEKAYKRLPSGLCQSLLDGVREGVIIPRGRWFELKDIGPGKGPYAWFDTSASGPNPNWEYYVQVSEFVRLRRIARLQGFTLKFEDHLMDLTLYRGQKLLVYIEVKERADQLQPLVAGIRHYEAGVDLAPPEGNNDPLQKANYIATERPEFFCAVAIGVRLEFRVEYPPGKAFELVPDVVPWL